MKIHRSTHVITRRFAPFRKGMGPTFALLMWDTCRSDELGKSILGYRLTMREPGKPAVTLFEAEDFHLAPSCRVPFGEGPPP